jgi:hypothetical protein
MVEGVIDLSGPEAAGVIAEALGIRQRRWIEPSFPRSIHPAGRADT